MRSRSALLLLLLVVALATGVHAPQASAHAEIRDSDPAVDGSAPSGIEEIEMTFIALDPDEPVEVQVLDAQGTDMVRGDVEVSARDSVVTVPVLALGEGAHTVVWSATSDDGDGISEGSFDFTVEEAPGGGFGVWALWIVALAIPAAIFLRPGGRRKAGQSR